MTIVTEPNIEKKVEKPQEKALVVNDGKHGTCPDHTVMDPNEDVEAWLSSAARRRVSAVSTVCVFITALLVMSMGITGGVYLSRQFSRHWMSRSRGLFEIPYEWEWLTRNESLTGSQPMVYKTISELMDEHEENQEEGAGSMPVHSVSDISELEISTIAADTTEPDLTESISTSISVQTDSPITEPVGSQTSWGDDAEWTSENLFEEEFELDLDDEIFEESRVPIIDPFSRVIYDFKTNKTGIIDSTFGRCYVMPLDRTRVNPPKDMNDLLKKLGMNYYKVDTEVVRETMRVVHPPVRIGDYNSLGSSIARECYNYPTYHLEHISSSYVNKLIEEEPEERQM